MLGWAKGQGLTTLFTSLLLNAAPQTEGTAMQISTIADTWIHLDYTVRAGERNRGLTIVKSRGAGHSNQVRELILSDRGISLADVYTTDGQVLMGTLRWEKERAVRAAQLDLEAELERKRVEIAVAQGDLNDGVKQLRRKLKLKQVELNLLTRASRGRQQTRVDGMADLKRLRGADRKADQGSRSRPPGSGTKG
jgi:circadian clock protein KaiC